MEATHYRNAEYPYSQVFWGKDKNRAYENAADQLLLRNAIRHPTTWIVDLGGGFGRLVPTLKRRSRKVLIVDASLDLLQEARASFGADPDVYYLRANIYHLPFKDLSVEAAVCTRVMHHIQNPDELFKELSRVVTTRLYLEFPNKKHLLQQLRFYFRSDNSIDVFSSRPEMRNQLFLNFTLRFMRHHLLATTTFSIERIFGASFLRQKHLKKLPRWILLPIENVLQHATFLAEWAPSILLVLQKTAATPSGFADPREILICPRCKAALVSTEQGMVCLQGHAFPFHDGLLDLFVE